MKSETRISEPTRRHHDRAFKARLVDQSLQPGASVAAIAMDNGINANLLFKWRRDQQRAAASLGAPTVLLPVRMTPATEEPDARSTSILAAVAPAAAKASRAGVIELDIAGAQLRLRGAVDEASLFTVLRALRQSAT